MNAKLNAGDRTAGLASLVEGFILKLQLASLQVVVWWPPILLPGQPALCSSVMAFAPSSTQAWSTRTNVKDPLPEDQAHVAASAFKAMAVN